MKGLLEHYDVVGGPVPQAMVGGGYEGASRRTSDLALWSPSQMPVDWDADQARPLGNARARDLSRNDSYVGAGVSIHKDGIVGAAYLLNARPSWKMLERQDRRFDETWAQEFQAEVEEKFTLLAESPRCWLDAQGTKTLTEIVRLAVGIDLLCGEVLQTAEWIRDSGRPCRTAIQTIEISRLSTPDTMIESRFLRQGIDRDVHGRPKGYYLRRVHPADPYIYPFSQPLVQQWRYVAATKPWGRPMVMHAFEENEAEQTRGVNSLMAAMQESRIMKVFRPVQLQNAIVQATFAAAIESELPTNVVYEMLGANGTGQDNAALAAYTSAYLGALEQYAEGAQNLKIDGVKIPHLLPGSKLTMQPAGANGQGVGEEFEKSLIRYLGAALRTSYPELSGDLSEVNYSSMKFGALSTWRHQQTKKKIIADRVANFAYGLWLEEEIANQRLTTLPTNARDLYYVGLNREAFSNATWIGAARGQIDELKETQAAVLRLKYNLSTYEDEMARLGKDWREVLRQRQRENIETEDHDLLRPDAGMDIEDAPEGGTDDA